MAKERTEEDTEDLKHPERFTESAEYIPESLRKAPPPPGKEYAQKVAARKGDVKTAKQMSEMRKDEPVANPSSYSKGGKVRKAGLALVHKGEKVLTGKESKKLGSKKREHARKKA